MKLQLIFYCALVFYLELAASVPHDVDTQKYSGVYNTRPSYETNYQPNIAWPYQDLNQNYNTGFPKINTVNKLSNHRQEYVPKDPQQLHQEQLPNNRYLNHYRLPVNNANSPIHRQWRNVNLPEFHKLPMPKNPESYLSVTEKEYLGYKNNHRFEAYKYPQARNVAPVPRYGNPNSFKENPHPVSVIEENRQFNTEHQELVQENEYFNKASFNTVNQSFSPQIPSVPPKRDPKAKSKSILINQTDLPIEINAKHKAPLGGTGVPPNFVNRLLARAENPVEQISKAVKIPNNNVQNIISNARINQILSSTKHRKRYLVIHPNGTIEHVDTLKTVSQRHPNYVLVHAGDIISNPTSKVNEVADSPQLVKPLQKAILNHTNVQNTSVATKTYSKEPKVEISVEPAHKEINEGRSKPNLNVLKAPITNPPINQTNNNKTVPSTVVFQKEVGAQPTVKVSHNNKTTPVSTVEDAPTYEIVIKTTPLPHVRETLVSVASAIQANNQTITKSIKNDQKEPMVLISGGSDKKATPIQVNTTTKSVVQVKKNETNHVPHNISLLKNIVHTKAIAEIVPEKKQIVNSTKAISKVESISAPSGKEKEPTNAKNCTVSTQPNTTLTIVYGADIAPKNNQLVNNTKAISISKNESVSAPVVLTPAKDKQPAITKVNVIAKPQTKPTIINGANGPPENNQTVNNAKATSASIPIVLTSGIEQEPATTKANTENVQPHTTFTIIYGANVPHDKRPTETVSNSSVASNATSKSSANEVIVEATVQASIKPDSAPVKSIAKAENKPPLNFISSKTSINTNTPDKKSPTKITEVLQNPKVSNKTIAEVNLTDPKEAQIPTVYNVITAFTSNAEKPKVANVTATQVPLKDNKNPGNHKNPVTPSSTKPISTAKSGPAKPLHNESPKIPGELDISKVKSQEKPAVWFRTTDPNFWDKLTDGNETYDVVYFFQIHNQPKVENDTKKTIYPNGTIVEEITKSVWEEGQETPKITTTTLITHPEDVK